MFALLIAEAFMLTPIFLFGSTGETLTEKSGHLNLGTPGIICMGGAGGMIGIAVYNSMCGGFENSNPFLTFVFVLFFALLLGALSGLLFSFFTVSLRCNQNVMGLAYTTFGIGFYSLTAKAVNKEQGSLSQYSNSISHLFMSQSEATNAFSKIFLAHGLLFYLSFVIAIVVAIVLKRTRVGLFVRTVGENAASADAAGINVSKYRYITTIIGCAISSLAGLYYFIEIVNGYIEFNNIDAYGWLAVALVIFTLWRTDLGIIGAILFAFLFKLPEIYGLPSPQLNMLFSYLPYFVTIVILIFISIVDKKAAQAPGNLGIPYFREER